MSPNPSPPLSAISQLLLFILLTTSSESIADSPEKTAASFFIFGDSTVDVGNNIYIETAAGNRANSPPYGQGGFFHMPTGRFSDGRVVVDFIAEYAKLPLIPPFRQPYAKFLNGANFASGGAGVLPETYQELNATNLQTQLRHFDTVVSSLNAEMGETEARKLITNAVYFISIGINDYLSYLSSPKAQETFTPEDVVGMVIGNLSEAIQGLYDKGARRFGVLSICPLGCLPALRAANPNNGGCFEDVSALALAHNNAMAGVLVSFEYILAGFKHAFSSDFYGWMHQVIHNPSEFGFKDGINACCGSGKYRGLYTCGASEGASDYELCDKPEDFVWWDAFHGTEKIAEKIADALWDGPPGWVGPYSLKSLFFDRGMSRVEDLVNDEESMRVFAA